MTLNRTAVGVLLIGLSFFALSFVTRQSADAGRLQDEVKIATVDVMTLLEEGLASTEFAPARVERRDELAGRVTQMEDQLQSIEAELRMLPQGDPRGQQLVQQYQGMQRIFQQTAQQASSEFQMFSAEQTAEIFNRVREAARQTASSMGYTHVFSNRGELDAESQDSLATITQEVLSRPVLMAPDAHDITDDVRKALGFQPAEAPQQDDTAETPEAEAP